MVKTSIRTDLMLVLWLLASSELNCQLRSTEDGEETVAVSNRGGSSSRVGTRGLVVGSDVGTGVQLGVWVGWGSGAKASAAGMRLYLLQYARRAIACTNMPIYTIMYCKKYVVVLTT